jgi:LuxR family maltose regulon positive regulatory protein
VRNSCCVHFDLSKIRNPDLFSRPPKPIIFPYNVYVPETLLQTKLYIPPLRPNLVPRQHLIERLNQGLQQNHKLSLISAPAGFGKTTLVSEWVASSERPAAWLSLDEGDNDPARFLAYLVAAIQTLALSEVEGTVANFGEGILAVLQSPQPPPTDSILTALLNEIATIPDNFVLVLDDYHVIVSQKVDAALTFFLDHLPPQLHLVITSRIDPSLPLSRLRAGGRMTEIREDDLRFSLDEIDTFLDEAMGLNLSAEKVAALETRTEGWIAGLQLAALSMQGLKRSDEIADFVDRFTGSDRYIQDYLADEVLRQRPKGTKDFLLQTSILNRLSGPLCDAVRFAKTDGTTITDQNNSQAILEALEAANLFIVPLDNERRWYRYHHLFADLLRQRLQQQQPDTVANLHVRASAWYEENGLDIEAFLHAAAANDVERAEHLIEGGGLPLQWRGGATPVLNWLESLPTTILDARPSLWVTYASTLVFTGRTSSIEKKLQAAEAALDAAALQGAEPDDKTQDLLGHIAALRAMMAVTKHQIDTITTQSRRALELLHPGNLPVRTAANWTLGYAYELQGDRAAASQAYTEVISSSQKSGNFMFTIAATTSLGYIQESENQLYLAAESHRHALEMAGDPPLPFACASYLGLARVLYEWNDLDTAQRHGQLSAQLAEQIEGVDTPAACGVFLARLKLAQGDVTGAAALLTEADQFVHQHNFMHLMSEVAAVQVLALLRQGPLLRQGNLAAAAHLAEKHDLPVSQARVHLAQGDTGEAIASLRPLRQQVEAKGLKDERLKVMVLQAVAYHAYGEKDKAVQLLGDALALAEPGGFIRIFLDEGEPMALLLSEAAAFANRPDYIARLLAEFEVEKQQSEDRTTLPTNQPLVEPLSQRELEVLLLVAEGLSNREISERLFLALNTVKGHNRRIFGKLEVQRRTEAVARARELGLL